MAESAQIANINHRHEGIADWLLANPHRQLKDCAEELRISQSHLSVIINSDAFRVYFARRRAILNDMQAQETVATLYDIVRKANAVVLKELEKEDAAAGFALDASTKALKSLGYGAASITVNDNRKQVAIGVVDRSTLEASRERLQRRTNALSEDRRDDIIGQVLPQATEFCVETQAPRGGESEGEELREENPPMVGGESWPDVSPVSVDSLLDIRE